MDVNPFTEVYRKLRMVNSLGNTDFIIKSKKTSTIHSVCKKIIITYKVDFNFESRLGFIPGFNQICISNFTFQSM